MDKGEGVEQDHVLAAEYFRLAADQGFVRGQLAYAAIMREKGDLLCAARYFKLAADHGDAAGAMTYGMCCLQGEGVDVNEQEAAKYFKLSADGGLARGQLSYAVCLMNGLGADKDESAGIEYLKRAVDQGLPDAVAIWELTQGASGSEQGPEEGDSSLPPVQEGS